MTLGPDHFRLPPTGPNVFPPPARRPLLAWRASFEAQLAWEEKLQARIDQDRALEDALRQAVDATEELTLPALRDALVEAAPVDGWSVDAKAKAVGDRLLIETRDSGCARTTRVAQAIETLQNLVFSLRTGQLRDTYPKLAIRPDATATFDDDWTWMGSYGAWRAAMFVFLYPENIALPSLRRQMTPAFRKLVKELRTGGRVTPERARLAADEYAAYFRDVCKLGLEATVTASVRLRTDQSGGGQADHLQERLFLFGRSPTSDKAFWCTRAASQAAETQTFWDEVPVLRSVSTLVGAAVYEITPASRFIYLFARVHDGRERKLAYCRYDLEAGRWLQEEGELDLPDNAPDFTATLLQKEKPSDPPRLLIEIPGGKRYTRDLGQKGKDWSGSDFQAIQYTVTYAAWQDASRQNDLKVKDRDGSSFDGREAMHWIKAAHGFAKSQAGFVAGFPNFHQVGDRCGVIKLTSHVAVLSLADSVSLGNAKPTSDPSFSVQDLVHRFVSVHKYVQQSLRSYGYVSGFPTFDDVGSTYGIVLLTNTAASTQSLHVNHLGGGSRSTAKDLVRLFTSANDITGQGRFGFPTFSEDHLNEITLCYIQENRTVERDPGKPVAVASLSGHTPDRRGPPSLRVYFEEAWYFVPVHVALQLLQAGHYQAALDWFRTVYDYSAQIGKRKIYHGLTDEESLKAVFERGQDWNWLRDPLDPHAIARSRHNAYTRFTLLSIVRCFLEYATAEFTRDTAESVPLARTLYQTALELLEDPNLNQQVDGCEEIIGQLKTRYGDEVWIGEVAFRLGRLTTVGTLRQARSRIDAIMGGGGSAEQRIARVRDEVEAALQAESRPIQLHEAIRQGEEQAAATGLAIMALPGVAAGAWQTGLAVERVFDAAVVEATGLPIDRLEREPLPWLRRGSLLESSGPVRGPGVDGPPLLSGPAGGALPVDPRLPPRRGLGSVLDVISGIEAANHPASGVLGVDGDRPAIADATTVEPVTPVAHEIVPGQWVPALVLEACIPPNPILVGHVTFD